MDLSFKLYGDTELIALLEALPKRMQKNVLATALRGGAAVIVKAARANLRANGNIRTGLLQKSITVKIKRYSRDGIIWAGIGANKNTSGSTPSGSRVVPNAYAHLLEFGTRTAAPYPYLRPAFDGNRREILAGITQRTRKGLAREIKKLRKATSAPTTS